MKNLLVFLFFVSSINSIAQDLGKVIVLKDADTNLPIRDATVFIAKFKQILLSNAEGKVFFVLKSPSAIQISHSSYKSETVRSSTLKENETVIYLESNVSNLDEIIVSKKHPQKILQNLVENSIKKLTIPARLQVYEREFFKLNGVNSYFNDGLLNFQITDRDKLYDTEILVEQNRSYGLTDTDISNDLLGYNLNNLIGNYYTFKYLNPLLDKKTQANYDFMIFGSPKNENYFIMKVSPLEEAKGLLDDYEILYDNKKNVIIEVSASISTKRIVDEPDKTEKGNKNIRKSFFKTIYKMDRESYYLISSREEIGFDRIEGKELTNIEVNNSFVITNFSDRFFTHKEKDVFKEKTLFNKKNVILTNYWNLSGLMLTAEEQEIIDKIIE